MTTITFAGHAFLLHPSGVLYWPDQRLAIVSDLHLEKGSFLARRGFFVPPYDSRDTLNRLAAALADVAPERLLVLGDTFHDAKGFLRLAAQDLATFETLRAYQPIWVRGNHDGAFVPPGFIDYDEIAIGNVIFRHEALADDHGYEISGHFHPKADIEHKGAKISRRCFVEDGRRMILPAFGSYTGGLSATDSAIARFFPDGFRLHVLGQARVFSITAPRQAS